MLPSTARFRLAWQSLGPQGPDRPFVYAPRADGVQREGDLPLFFPAQVRPDRSLSAFYSVCSRSSANSDYSFESGLHDDSSSLSVLSSASTAGTWEGGRCEVAGDGRCRARRVGMPVDDGHYSLCVECAERGGLALSVQNSN